MKVIFLLVTFFVLAAFMSAQQFQPLTELTGTVFDQAGAVIADVQITLSDVNGKKYAIRTNDDGLFSLKVPAGKYQVEAEYTRHKAWEPFRVENYEVAAAKRMTLDLCLRIDEKFTELHGSPVQSEKKRKP